MNGFNNLSKTYSPQKVSKLFKILAVFQAAHLLFHYWDTYFPIGMEHKGWGWKGAIKMSYFNPDGILNKKHHLPDAVDVYAMSSDIIFNFPSFGEWLNLYTFSFFLVDTLKWLIPVYVFWQLSKAMSYKTDFIGFTTDGVKYTRRAAEPIILIPIFEYISKWMFVKYAGTQSTYTGFSKYPSAVMMDNPISWVYYLYATLILLGLSEIFRYGMQLKEETDLTV